MGMTFEDPSSNVDQLRTNEPPLEVLRSARFTRIESPENQPPEITFYVRDGEPPIHSILWTPEAATKYFPTIQSPPPFSNEELEAVRQDFRDRLASLPGVDVAVSQRLRQQIDEKSEVKDINMIEDEIYAFENPPVVQVQSPAAPGAPQSARQAPTPAGPIVQRRTMGGMRQTPAQALQKPEKPKEIEFDQGAKFATDAERTQALDALKRSAESLPPITGVNINQVMHDIGRITTPEGVKKMEYLLDYFQKMSLRRR